MEFGSRTLISAAAFTSSDESWTTTASAELSRKLLEDHFGSQVEQQQKRAKFITEDVLSDLLRPLFSKSRPATVTASGRKAEYVEPSRYDNASAEAEARKPWKYGRRYAITVFEWALLNSDVGISLLFTTHCPPFSFLFILITKTLIYLPIRLRTSLCT